MRKLQSQGVHHITIVGADRQTSIDFWEGVLGMPFVFEQPNLDNESESHLYSTRATAVITSSPTRDARRSSRTAKENGCVTTSRSRSRRPRSARRSSARRAGRPPQRGSRTAASWTRLFKETLGLLIELASYLFEPTPAS